MSLRVVPVPCLADNYAYLVLSANGSCAVVDPSEPGPVRAALAREGAKITEIWCTHHHLDHVGGVAALVGEHPGVLVRASAYDGNHDRIPALTNPHNDGDHFSFEGSEVRIISIPGHTLGAIAFLTEGELFSGDTLFLGGCGRVFEGTMPMMARSMRRLRDLDPATRVWCGHEYTAANLRFARTIEPENQDIVEALALAERASESALPTVPGTLAAELLVNPFLRFELESIATGLDGDASFARLREAKNDYRG